MLPIYDTLVEAQKNSNTQDAPIMSKIFNSLTPKFFAGLISMSLVYPLDTIKRCLMVSGSRGYSSYDVGLVNVVKSIYNAYGVRGFYRGIHIALLRAYPSILLQFTLYDIMKRYSVLSEFEGSYNIVNLPAREQSPAEVTLPEVVEVQKE